MEMINAGDVTGDRGPRSSQHRAWDDELLDLMRAHVEAERTLLSEYADAVLRIEEADVRYLMSLILEDESRHHRMFEDMVRALEGARTWKHMEPSVPERTTDPLGQDVQRITEQFLEAERDDRRELKKLRRKLSPVEDTTLWALLVDLMALDTEKHVRILETIASRKGEEA